MRIGRDKPRASVLQASLYECRGDASQGECVFITTSSYSAVAKEYARMLQNRVILVDGEMLANLMIESNVGVSLEKTYEVKRVDSDYFDEV